MARSVLQGLFEYSEVYQRKCGRSRLGRQLYVWTLTYLLHCSNYLSSTASVGQYAIQLATMHKFKVITTCSERNFDLVKSLGAHHVFDYRNPDVVKQIREVVPDLENVFDTIGGSDSSKLASNALKETGGRLCTVRPGKANTESVSKQTTVTDVLVWTAFLRDHRYGDFFWPVSAFLGIELIFCPTR